MSEFLKACAVAASALLWTAAAVAWVARHGAFASVRRDWRGCPRARKGLAAVVVVVAVAWAGVKPSGEETADSHGFAWIEGAVPTALNAEDSEERRHGDREEWVSMNQHESTRISIRDDSCQFVDKNSTGGLDVSHGDTEARRIVSEGWAERLEADSAVEGSASPNAAQTLRASVAPCEASSAKSDQGYSLSRIGTNEVFSFAPPEGAVIAEIWRRHGAATDWRRLSFDGWEFPFGEAAFSSLVVFANGTILLSTNAALRPVTASLGLVPAANWGRLAESNRPSLFWHGMRDDGSLLLTWQNALLHRAPTNPVSFQAELFPSGNVTFRYDLSRLASDGLLTNVMGGVEAGEGKRKKEEGRSAEGQISFLLSRETTSLTFVSDSERRCEEARDAFDEALGGLDPLACPSGSTNTVWEHLVYAGTTNGAFAYPQSTERTAVLRVTVTGAGRGEFLVGGRAISLVGERSATLNTEETEGRRHGVVATNSREFARIEGVVPTALNALPLSTNLHESTRISIRENSCQFVDKIVSGGSGASHGGTYPPSEASCTAGAMRGEARRVKPEGQLELSDRGTPVEGPGDLHSLRASVSPCETSTPNVPSLLLPVPRGQTIPLYLRASGSLAVSFASADFAFGRLPDLAAHRPTGRINFPNVSATTPCFHDYRARQREVTLPVGADAAALTCTWKASDSVTVENVPPRSARLTGNFDGRTTTPITYTLAHPDYLFGQTTCSQTARFCPPPPEEEEEDPSAGRHYGSRDEDEDEDEPCWHCVWGLCGEGCDCCGNCRHSGAPETERPGGPSEEEEPQPGDYEAAATNWPHLTGVLKIREPLLFAPPIRLEVPDADAPRCCPCPDHATNWVAVAYLSDRLKAVDANGLDFRSAAETVDVRLAGVRPSRAVGDAFVSFATNGAVCLDGAYTVLGVGVRREGVDLAALDSLNADFGLPIPVATNAAEAAALELVTAVGLDGGNVRVGFEEASAPFALWAWDSASNACRPLASSDGGPLDVSLAAWRRLVGGATDAETSRTRVTVTASALGAATLVFRYWGVFNGRFVEDVARQRLTAVSPPIMADFNRDGRIDGEDVALCLAGRPFCYWFNGDTFKGDFIGASADGSRNADDLRVNGTFDLVNLFPVALDFSAFRAAWGPHATYVVRPVSADSFNFCLADVPWSEAGTVQTAPRVTLDGDALATAPLAALPPEGRAFAHADLARLSPSSGVMLCEATRAGVSLVAEVRVGDMAVYSHVLPMDIRSVRDMYGWINGRPLSGVNAGRPTQLRRAPGETFAKSLVFLHGANVSSAEAEIWGDILFKRLWLAGVKADFYNVDWRSDIGSPANYHENASNAFAVAASLAPILKGIPGEKIVMAHSLGNMVVSSMIQDHGLVVSRYLMCNSAVPAEAYDASPSLRAPQLVHRDWDEYPPKARANEWYRLFENDVDDDRARLTWAGRFADVANVAVNFYSTGDHVLELYENNRLWVSDGYENWDQKYERYSWHKQELGKGRSGLAFRLGTTNWSGWGIRENLLGYNAVQPTNAWLMGEAELRTNTVFGIRPASMDARSIPLLVRGAHLAQGIPARTPACGATAWGEDDLLEMQMINLNSLNGSQGVSRPNGWPSRKFGWLITSEWTDQWLHSDMKDVSYYYNYKFFGKVKEMGDLENE